jgi:Raf kinase inhibitor-like YbhB/YbcL family protein
MKSMCGRIGVLVCVGVFLLSACSSSSSPRFVQNPNEAVEAVASASTYVRLMAESAPVANVAGFRLTSPTFVNNEPIRQTSMIGNSPPQCEGGDLSPILNWANPPAGTKSFALILFDETANFGHWGIYNMRPNANRLPQGVKPGNIVGLWNQVYDDAGVQGYFGPCPPPGIVHRYVFTIYALDVAKLTIQNNPGLNPPNVEALLYSMIGHVIGRASYTGLLQKP